MPDGIGAQLSNFCPGKAISYPPKTAELNEEVVCPKFHLVVKRKIMVDNGHAYSDSREKHLGKVNFSEISSKKF